MKCLKKTKIFCVASIMIFGIFSTPQNARALVLDTVSEKSQGVALFVETIVLDSVKTVDIVGEKYVSGIYNTASAISSLGNLYTRGIYAVANFFHRSGEVYTNGIYAVADKITSVGSDNFYAKNFAGYDSQNVATVTQTVNKIENKKIENKTVVMNGITEDYLERRLVSFQKSLKIPDAIQIRNRDVNGSNISVDRIYDSIGESADSSAEDAVTGGNFSFSGINGTFTGDVTVAGALSANSLSASALTISATSTFNGATNITGPLLADDDAGTSGYVLQTTGTGVQWVATSSLGISSGGTWGSITGTLADQTDLQSVLDAKQNSFATGTSAEYLKGDLTLGTFPTTTSAFFNDSEFATGTPWTSEGYLTSFTELDPVFTASDVAGVLTADISNWNTAFGWGDHAGAGYITGLNWNQIGGTQSDINVSGFSNDSGFVSNLSSFTTDDLTQGSTNKYSQWTTSGSYVYYNSGNVGIGTTNPGSLLEISLSQNTPTAANIVNSDAGANARSDLRFSNGTDIGYVFYTGTNNTAFGGASSLNLYNSANSSITLSTNATERMRITNAGNVGIGTTAIPYLNSNTAFFSPSSSGKFLELYSASYGSNINLRSGINTDEGVLGGVYWTRELGQGDAHRQVAAIQVREEGTGTLAGGKMWFFTKTSGAGVDSNVPRMVITETGNVGIGTVSPSSTLHVNGMSVFAGSTFFTSSNTGIFFDSYNTYNSGIFKDTSGNVDIRVNSGTERMTITSSGLVGIGTTAPGYPLQVVGVISSSGNGAGFNFSDRTSNQNWQWYGSGATAILWNGSANTIGITSAGLMGIGTISPSNGARLDIADGGMSMVLGADSNATTRTNNTAKVSRITGYHYSNAEEPVSIFLHSSSATDNIIAFGGGTSLGNAATSLNFYTAANTTTTVGTSRMNINSTGLVGIGTTATSLLHLKGNATSANNLLTLTNFGNSNTLLNVNTATDNPYLNMNNSSNSSTVYLNTNGDSYFNGGNVGIGTDSPGTRLHVKDIGIQIVRSETTDNTTSSIATLSAYSNQASLAAVAHATARTVSRFGITLGGWSELLATSGSTGTPNGLVIGIEQAAPIVFGTDNTERMRILSGGNIGIGTTEPQQKLHVIRSDDGAPVRFEDSNGYCEIDPTSTAWSCTSDERLKENISSLNQTDSLAGILALNPVSFEWKTDGSDTQRIGLIAQEVERIFPDLVNTDRQTGFKSVSYGSFTTYIIGAIQELNVKIENVFASLVDQVVEVRELIAGKLKINGDVCVDDVCVTKEQFKEMLRKGGGTASVVEIVDEGTDGAGTSTEDGAVETGTTTNEEIGTTGTSTDEEAGGGGDTSAADPIVEPTTEPIVPPAEIVPPPESDPAPVDDPATVDDATPVETTPEPEVSDPSSVESAPVESDSEAVI